MKECVVVLEGVDKTGKDTIKDLLVKASQGKALVIVRSYISQIVYARIYYRHINEEFFISEMSNAIKRGHKFFLLTADKRTLKSRFELTDETDLKINKIDSHIKMFREVVASLPFANQIIEIDTSDNTPANSMLKILGMLR